MDKQIKRVVSYYRTTHRRGDKAGSVLLRTVEEIKRVVSYYRTTYRRGDKGVRVKRPAKSQRTTVSSVVLKGQRFKGPTDLRLI